ncbi:MAG: hypothetical protein QOF51_1800 [Chloroflexota bacterium]|jgi:2-polyprenyl-6-methoxyphenol hydroxylase-like FAD-dependent oxidoreductase|nr:hypothetical protein [Chloroflexota bacterium]
MQPDHESHAPNGRHALVLGGGIAGLTTARVLADHFERVTLVERDRLPAGPATRVGVPQSQHVHVLLQRGKVDLGRLFPGLEAELEKEGAPLIDGARDVAWLTPAGWAVRFPSTFIGHPCSRPLLEWCVRRRLTQIPNVSVIEERSAVGLLASADRSHITGARIGPAHRDDATPETEVELQADLTVDATGRGSRAATWLKDLGYSEPRQTEINAFLGYATRLYRLKEDAARDWAGLYVQIAPPARCRGGVLFELEQGQWIASFSGAGRDYPPTDEAGFLEFARSLPTPLFYDAIKDAEPISPIVGTRSTSNIWRHYESLPRWPDGFVVIGDATCAFNPVYGQGMSVAAMEAVRLGEHLGTQRRSHPDGSLDGLAQRVQKDLPHITKPVWLLATGSDIRVPSVEGAHPSFMDQMLYGYLDRVVQAGTEDKHARLLLLEVLNLLRPATALFEPAMVARVIRGLFSGRTKVSAS